LTTKDMLAESLKELLTRRSLDKITVKDIVENCGKPADVLLSLS
jgi:hypothetical protein